MNELELIKKDFLRLIDCKNLEKKEIKNLLKSTVKNFFDYLKDIKK